jgi:hypothetical protein
MKIWVFMSGGYFDGTLYGVFDEENLPPEILLHHYENPRATMQGVTILGITKKGPDDITVVERYLPNVHSDREFGERRIMEYNFEGQVDPSKVRKRIIDADLNEYVLEEIEEGDEASD